MQPNFRRFLPVLIVAALMLFLVSTVLKKHNSGPSAGTRSSRTIDAMTLIDRGERTFKVTHGRYTEHLADLLAPRSRLASDLAVNLGVRLDVSTDGHAFLAQVASDVLSLVRGRNDGKLTAQSCLVLKRGSGVSCPVPAR